MLKLHQVSATPEWWQRVAQFRDRVTFQTEEWTRFLADTHHATPVCAEVRDGSSLVGCFHSLLVQRLGIRLLGSPFPGWTTEYMGFNLEPGIPRWLALRALESFAFRDLNCIYFEVADRLFTPEDGKRVDFQQRISHSYESYLVRPEEAIFAGMAPSCRGCIRKAERCGVVIEAAAADDGFAEEYYTQLKEVFCKDSSLPTYPLNTVRKLIHHLHPTGNLALLRARDSTGKCIATGIYHGVGNFAQLWGNASLRDFLHLRPNQAMHWHAIRYWRDRGAEYFDWGGAGDYKAKYGCRKVQVIRFSKSRVPILSRLRDEAQKAFLQQLRWRFWWEHSAAKKMMVFQQRGLV